MQRFERGQIGASTEESNQVVEIIRTIKTYFNQGLNQAVEYGVDERMFNSRVIPYVYISRKLSNSAAFRRDRMGASNSIKRTLQTMIDSGQIVELNKGDMAKTYNSSSRAFMVSDMKILN